MEKKKSYFTYQSHTNLKTPQMLKMTTLCKCLIASKLEALAAQSESENFTDPLVIKALPRNFLYQQVRYELSELQNPKSHNC